ncbi:MAG: leucine-rich repeat protein [Treponema sp.]|jgi:hypothetical protein|nr:leucine-rich repeat protein [Treponema sp.]
MKKTVSRLFLAALVLALGFPACNMGDKTSATAVYKAEAADGITNGAVTLSPANAEAGAYVIITVTPDAGYRYTEGSLNVNNGAVPIGGSYPQYFFKMPAGNVTVEAAFTAATVREYTITFNSAGGTAVPPIKADEGALVDKPADPLREGYIFLGWFSTADGGELFSWPYTLNGNLTMHAQWITQYTITFSVGEGGGSAPASQTVNAENAISLPAQGSMTAPSGKSFAGWKTDGGGTYAAGASYTASGSVTFTAQWKIQSINDVKNFLAAASGGQSAVNPVSLALTLNLASDWNSLLSAIYEAGKYVALDLSECTMSGTEFDPGTRANTWESKIVFLVLPNVATSIKYYSLTEGKTFRYFTSLKSISGSGITSIGAGAFSRCTSLTTANFPLATSIGNSAFSVCTSLTTADFPSATSIGDSAFYGCYSLTTADFPSATSIGDSAFSSCNRLTTVNIPNAETIGYFAFQFTAGQALTITLGSAAPTLGYRMFDYVSASKTVTVKVPAGATGYGTVPATYSGYDTTERWGNGFRGGGWENGAFSTNTGGGASSISQNITLKIEYK